MTICYRKLNATNGGEPVKIYRVVEGADFQVKTATQRANNWRKEKNMIKKLELSYGSSTIEELQ